VLKDSTLFATFSDDGTTKVWDVQKLEGRNLISKAKLSYSQQGLFNKNHSLHRCVYIYTVTVWLCNYRDNIVYRDELSSIIIYSRYTSFSTIAQAY